MLAVVGLVAVAAAADGYLTSQVGEQVRARHEASARTIVVVVDSANDVGTFQRAVGPAPWLIVSALGPGGVEGTRTASGADCALHVTRAGAGNFWTITESGNCSPASQAPAPMGAPSPVPAPAPDLVSDLVALPDNAARKARLVAMLDDPTVDPAVAGRLGEAIAVVSSLEATKRSDPTVVRLFLRAALDPDPAVRQAAVAAARANGDPPTVASAPYAVTVPHVVAVAPSADPALVRKYRDQHLVRGPMNFTMGTFDASEGGVGYVGTVDTWTVRDGGGAPHNTVTFAKAVGDSATVSRLDRQKKKATTTAVVLAVAGAGIVAGGLAMYDEDQSLAVPLTLTGIGFAVGLSAIVPPVVATERRTLISAVYTPEAADRWIASYNAALRARLGLTQADVQSIDLAP
jgi:hypothetical protein